MQKIWILIEEYDKWLLTCKIVNLTRNSKMSTHTFIENFTEVILKIAIFLCCLCDRLYFPKMATAIFPFPHVLLETCLSLQEVCFPPSWNFMGLWDCLNKINITRWYHFFLHLSLPLSLPLNTQPWNSTTLLWERPGYRRQAFQLTVSGPNLWSVSKPNHRVREPSHDPSPVF